MVRLVRTADGVQLDPTGKMAGRGAYVHADAACWQPALKGAVAKALRTTLQEEERARLMEALEAVSPNQHEG